jgi:divalent metal cation (Fe/Co/Zn/Cd) transporter
LTGKALLLLQNENREGLGHSRRAQEKIDAENKKIRASDNQIETENKKIRASNREIQASNNEIEAYDKEQRMVPQASIPDTQEKQNRKHNAEAFLIAIISTAITIAGFRVARNSKSRLLSALLRLLSLGVGFLSMMVLGSVLGFREGNVVGNYWARILLGYWILWSVFNPNTRARWLYIVLAVVYLWFLVRVVLLGAGAASQ